MKPSDSDRREAMTGPSRSGLPQSLLREFFLGFVKIHILHHAAEDGAVYGLQLIRELARHGYELSPGTLYPILHGLENSGYVVAEKQVVGGKIRKYYRATALGQQALVEVRAKIGELVSEVLPTYHELKAEGYDGTKMPSRD